MALTPPSSHGGSGPAFNGWTSDGATPANIDGGAGSLTFDDGTNGSALSAEQVILSSDSGGSTKEEYGFGIGDGVFSHAPADTPCYAASDRAGATVALDCDGITIINLPTSDPGIAGGLYTTGGAVLVSAG